jgi:hypothetical protein
VPPAFASPRFSESPADQTASTISEAHSAIAWDRDAQLQM